MEVQLHVLLNSVHDGAESSVSSPDCFTPGEKVRHSLLSKRLGGPQDRFGRYGKGTIYFYWKEDILLAILNACFLSLF